LVAKVGLARQLEVSIAVPDTGTHGPLIRTNALPLGMPSRCFRLELTTVPDAAELEKLENATLVPSLPTARGRGKSFLGTAHTCRCFCVVLGSLALLFGGCKIRLQRLHLRYQPIQMIDIAVPVARCRIAQLPLDQPGLFDLPEYLFWMVLGVTPIRCARSFLLGKGLRTGSIQ
jgi:hypothetical protein